MTPRARPTPFHERVLDAASGPSFRTSAFFQVSWRVHLANISFVVGVLAAVVGLGLLFNLPGQEIFASFIVIFLCSLALGLSFPFLVPPQDRSLLVRLVLAGLLIRIGIALIAHASLPVGFFAPDQFTYQDVGWRTLLHLRGEGPAPRQISGTVEVGYFYWNTFLYAVFGFAPIAPKLVNCFLGVFAALFAYRIAGGLAGREVALNTAVLVTLFPSLVLWSTQNLRDTAVVFFIVAILYMTLRIRARPSGPLFLTIVVSLAVLAFLRDYMALMMVMTLLGSFAISPKQNLGANILIGIALFALALVAYQQLGLGAKWVESASFEALQAQREALAFGGTVLDRGADVSTPLAGLTYLPRGMALFLLAPFPWQLGSMLSLMTLPEMLIWYSLIPAVLLGAALQLRSRFAVVEPIFLFVALTGSVYALVEGNAGTAYRHRAQIIVFLLIFAAVGIEAFRSSMGKRPRRRAPNA